MTLQKRTLILGGVWLLLSGAAMAQNPTGTIVGHVIDQSGLPVPGVTVSAESPNLQGVRIVVTSDNGDFIFALLPPGEYALSFELSGFQTLQRTVTVASTQTVPLDVTLAIGGIAEQITVFGDANAFVATAQVAAKFPQELASMLPTSRTLDASILLAPALHPTGPLGNYSIAGSMSFENLFAVNGVVVNENLRGQPHSRSAQTRS